MGRPLRPEIYSAAIEARRYVRYQLKEADRIGYPHMSTFARDIARGTLSAAPTPEDPIMDQVGRFLWDAKEIERRAVFEFYGSDDTLPRRAARCSMTPGRLCRLVDRVLTGLSGYLKGCRN